MNSGEIKVFVTSLAEIIVSERRDEFGKKRLIPRFGHRLSSFMSVYGIVGLCLGLPLCIRKVGSVSHFGGKRWCMQCDGLWIFAYPQKGKPRANPKKRILTR